MRVVSWNLRGGTDAKWDLLRSLDADVAVLPEAARAPGRAAGSLLEPAAHWHWVGVNPQKGLAVTTFAAPSGVLAAEATGRWSIGVRSGGLTVLGVWSCPSGGGYAREVHRAVDAHVRWFHPDGDVIVAGDFNVDAAGALRRRSGDFRRLAERLHGLGLTSAYHLVRHEPYGAESRPTYYHHRNAAHPFHIDFCFVSKSLVERVRAVEVGTFDDWVAPGYSDHVPIIIELA